MRDPVNFADLELERWDSETSDEVAWAAGYFAYGGDGADASTAVYYEIEPGCRLGWHSNSAEEAQFFISGIGRFEFEDELKIVSAGDFIVIPAGAAHDLWNESTDMIRAVAFFNDGEVEHYWNGETWRNGAGATCVYAGYDVPNMPILTLHQGCFATQDCTSKPSSPS